MGLSPEVRYSVCLMASTSGSAAACSMNACTLVAKDSYGVVQQDVAAAFDRNWCITYAGPGPSPVRFSRSGASEDLGTDGDTRRPLASERQMVSVTIGVTVTDDSDPSPACEISSVTSSEPSAASDWSVTGPLSLSLRADRNGLGPGRIYSITVKCTNVSQLSASAEVSVLVPHDRR